MITVNKRKRFYDAVRNAFFGGKISHGQFENLEAIIDEWNQRGFKDLRWLAYMLATVYHETGKTMAPIEEWGRGAKRDYGRKLKMGKGPGKRIPYTLPNKLYYGRGHVMLTWFENYELMGEILKLPLLQQPELMLDIHVSIKVMFEGMTTGASAKGDFTSHSLEMYFNEKVNNPLGARKVINGTDKAELIAGYYDRFLFALS